MIVYIKYTSMNHDISYYVVALKFHSIVSLSLHLLRYSPSFSCHNHVYWHKKYRNKRRTWKKLTITLFNHHLFLKLYFFPLILFISFILHFQIHKRKFLSMQYATKESRSVCWRCGGNKTGHWNSSDNNTIVTESGPCRKKYKYFQRFIFKWKQH